MANLLPGFVVTEDYKDARFDSVLLVGKPEDFSTLGSYGEEIKCFNELDKSNVTKVVACSKAPGGRIVFSQTGPADGDFDDVRIFQDAGTECMKKALSSGSKNPLLVLPSHKKYKYADKLTLLGVLYTLYTPVEVREFKGDANFRKVQNMGLYSALTGQAKQLAFEVSALEAGRIIARDIGGSDPERMAPPMVAKYMQDYFKGTCINIEVINDESVFQKDYPLLAAVNRCCRNLPRQAGQLIKLEYIGSGNISQTLMLVGKGITYDTGGADIKAGGFMQGMHRDKCGAAAVAGFFKTLEIYKPKGLKVIGALSMVRNGVGSDCYVSDEIIVSRAGVRVRVGNTDAEGRMVMADVLCEMKEKAKNETNPFIFTVATLTGHAIRCYGEGYGSILDNGPARKAKISEQIATAGEESGDPMEITRLRKEDFVYNQPATEYEDVLQCKGTKPSTMTNRGHQYPAAFLMTASGLEKHGCNTELPLPYTHMDIAGSSGPFPGIPTGSPVVALAHAFVLNRESSVV